MTRYIFLRIAWMKNYRGVSNHDIPTGAGSYVEENHDGGEVYNFYPMNGFYYGYARIQMGRSLRIEKLGAATDDEFINDVTVILFAKNPETGGQYIVGWYRNAKLYRTVQIQKHNTFPNGKSYMVKASIKDSHLIQDDERIKQVEGPGQTNAWYVEEYVKPEYFVDLENYMADPENYIKRSARKIKIGHAWQKNLELRKAVEFKAMDVVAEYFAVRNYEISLCHKENYGWDIEAKLGKQTLLLEVKGLSGYFNAVDLTPNEYSNSKINRKHYRICVVSYALDENKRKLEIFYFENGRWRSRDNKLLSIKEFTAAQFY